MATSIPVMDHYEVHSNVADQSDFMDKFRQFAITAGWTVQTWQPGMVWADTGGGVYGWGPGDEDFLEIRSTGYGGQAMQFRFRLWKTGTNNNRYMHCGAFKGAEGYDTANSEHPVDRNDLGQGKWNNYAQFALSSDVMPQVWLFGNEKYLLAVIQYDENYIEYFYVGTLVMHDTSETEAYFCGMPVYQNLWYNKNASYFMDAAGGHYHNFYRNGIADDINPNFTMGVGKSNMWARIGPTPLYQGTTQNLYSSRIPIFQQHIFQLTGDNRWQEIGAYPFGRINVDGKKIGERVKYGAEEYVTFPYNIVDVNTCGFAVRIS